MLLIDCHSGAFAHGTTNTISAKNSFRGVFVAPNSFLLGLEDITYVSDPKTDQVYYELKRFIELLLINNPIVIELLNMPTDSIRYRNGLFGLLKPEIFLSKLCSRTYTEFALEQLNRIQRQNAQLNYVPSTKIEKKNLSDFCYINSLEKNNARVNDWLTEKKINPRNCGLTPVPHTKDAYRLYEGKGLYKGLFLGEDQHMRLVMSDIPEGRVPIAYMVFDERELAAYTRNVREQKELEEYKRRIRHEQSNPMINSQIFMEIVRLLSMAKEIAKEGAIITRRPNADMLIKIRSGSYSYEYLSDLVKNMVGEVLQAFRVSPLPPAPNKDQVQRVLLEIRARFVEKTPRTTSNT